MFTYEEYDEDLVRRAIADLVKTAGDTSIDLYSRNQKVYQALRYGVPVKTDVGAPTDTVWLINDRFAALMGRHLPKWRIVRAELNVATLSQEKWPERVN